jgi:hypothetical protein
VQQLLIALALSLIVSACNFAADRDIRAYNVCLARHAGDAMVCEGPRQAYEVDASDIPARATASRPAAGYWDRKGSAVAGPGLTPVPLHPGPMPVTRGPNG